jgi:membrane protein required for colicin V production
MDQLGITTFDIGVIVVVLLSTLFAFARGLIRELIAVVSWVGAAVVAWYAFEPARPYMQDVVGEGLVADGLTVAVVFLVPLIALKVVGAAFARAVALVGLGGVDRLLGGVFGVARGALIVCLAYVGIDLLMAPDDRPDWLRNARTLPYVQDGVVRLRELVPDGVAEELGRQARALDDPRALLAPPEVPRAEGTVPPYTEEDLQQREELIRSLTGEGEER